MLTLINGGTFRLHQNCVFSAVNIEGTYLTAGTHYYAELLANYPNNIEAGRSGSITVQPYGPAPLLITTQPGPQQLYAGRTGHFTATISGTSPITYQWLKNGVPLADGGNISGTTNTTLTISNVAAGDAANYSLRATNVRGTTTSTAVALSLATPAEIYESAVVAANPAAFYQLNETSDPAVIAQAWDYVGGYNGTYGTAVQNGNPTYNIAGPLPAAGFPGFAAGNKAAQFVNGTLDARVTVAPWNLNTNTVTITAWINPTGTQYPYNGIVFCRGGGTVAGLNYSPGVDASGNYTLGYTWNNDWETYNWDSTLVAPPGQWSLVALVVTPTNATIHVMNTNGLVASSHPWNHVVQAFGGTTLIGDDSNASNGTRVFNGTIDDVAIFNSALSPSQIVALYSAASGISSFAPAIGGQPLSQTLYAGQTAQFVVAGGGTEPVSYRWQMSPSGAGTFSDLTDGGKISGATTPTLIISNLAEANTADYRARIFSSLGTTNSSAASLTVLPTFPSENITLSVQQATGTDWDTGADWSDGQAASLSAVMKPGSTYEVLAGARLRSPQSPRMAVFPGDRLTLDGNGIRVLNPDATTTNISEIRFKQPSPGTVIFKKLVMNGGQLDAGNDGVVVIGGEINVLTNAPFNNDSGNDRGYRIDAKLTGSGNIEYYGYNQTAFVPAYVNNLNIAGANNTFSGKWNVVSGTLLGTGSNALGTNDIVIGANGAWETTYDINNPNGSLLLNGRMYLHQSDTFRSVLIGGVAIPPGTYTFSQLSTTYSNNFPVAWTPQTGATNFSTGSGSLTVLGFAPPTFVTQPLAQTLYVGQTAQFTVAALGGQPLSYRWQMGTTSLSDGGRISGSTTTNLTITNLVQGDSADYVVVIANSAGSVTSSVARLTVQPTGPPMNITISAQQPTGSDWDTAADWSDGLAASVSALVKPGSTYEVLPGARLRTPAGAADATFPGDVLTVDGDGVWVNNNGATIGESRLKHATGGTVRFNKLVMNGGQLDSASDGNGNVVIVGEMNILANTPLYNDSGNDRGFQIDAWLTGNGSIEYHAYTGAAFNPGYVYNLNITGTSNTFSGQWNVVQGVLLGSGANSLGTNDITIGANAALETTYDIYNPQGKLVLDGQMFLHQNDSFHEVIIGGVPLATGTYTFAQLAAAYPANFPVSWTLQTGSTVSTGSGSIAVGVTTPPVKPPTMTFSRQGTTLTLGWPTEAIGFKLQSTPVLPATTWQDVAGSETTNSVSVTIGAGNQYFRLKK
jgi:hypothetical protein